MRRICVIGSLNVDLTITVPRFHAPGETISGTNFATFTGGKGGNQAVALGRLGADVAMVGCVGRDENGRMYRQTLQSEGVDDRFLADRDVPTGVALIEVDESTGDNRIALYAGANALVDAAYVDSLWEELAAYDIFLMQLEIPLPTVLRVAERVFAAGKTLVLDPAPARPLPPELCRWATYLTPNETELALITGMPTDTPDQVLTAAEALLAQGAKNVVAKIGAEGALYVSAQGAHHAPGFRVRAVDTTAAGDSFNAAFALALALGQDAAEALVLANAVAALATTAMGAQAAMPTLAAARALMAEQGRNP